MLPFWLLEMAHAFCPLDLCNASHPVGMGVGVFWGEVLGGDDGRVEVWCLLAVHHRQGHPCHHAGNNQACGHDVWLQMPACVGGSVWKCAIVTTTQTVLLFYLVSALSFSNNAAERIGISFNGD